MQDQHAVLRHAVAGEAYEPLLYRRVKRTGMHIVTQLHRARRLVHMLTAGSGRFHEALGYQALIKNDVVSDGLRLFQSQFQRLRV
ncbi:hypothetical protein GCM10007420_21120 [Glycocaulis albus]|uniref:Uncharacterized protein n=1 Tax=Glycocaulis albus TaxID=1382801 RepID=A0ABQ1XVK7_9PROT|nr:hypothetical protein GCM10007420_21120 [Glycocaulis albus]